MLIRTILCITILISIASTTPASAQNDRWNTIDSVNRYRYRDLSCADSLHCAAIVSKDNTHSIIRTTNDGGRTWTNVLIDSFRIDSLPIFRLPPIYYRVAHPTPNVIIVVCDSSYVCRSVDAGRSWEWKKLGTMYRRLQTLSMYDSLHGAISTILGEVYVTNNGGATWKLSNPLPAAIQDQYVNDVSTPSERTIILDMSNYPTKHACAYSSDAGQSWDVREGMPNCVRMHWLDTLEGWAVGLEPDSLTSDHGNDIILHTTNGGRSWTEQVRRRIDRPYGLFDIDFIDRINGVAVGGIGKILRTTDGGESWTKEFWDFPPGEIAQIISVKMLTLTRSIFVTVTGVIGAWNALPANITVEPPRPIGFYVSPTIIEAGQPVEVSVQHIDASQVDIVNVLGQTVRSEPVASQSSRRLVIPTDRLSAGTYFIVLRDASSTILGTRRVTIQ